ILRTRGLRANWLRFVSRGGTACEGLMESSSVVRSLRERVANEVSDQIKPKRVSERTAVQRCRRRAATRSRSERTTLKASLLCRGKRCDDLRKQVCAAGCALKRWVLRTALVVQREGVVEAADFREHHQLSGILRLHDCGFQIVCGIRPLVHSDDLHPWSKSGLC